MCERLCIECFRELEDHEDDRCLFCEEGIVPTEAWEDWIDFDLDVLDALEEG
jgi:hypothetical protein